MEMNYPKTRMDNFFAKAAGSELADNNMEPITDREYWINQMARTINGYQLEEDNMEPKTRMDNFFAKAAGSELADNDMVPITDREYWINEMAAKIAQGGGGGDSDFSIANVTIVNTYSGRVNLCGPVVFDENGMGEGAPALAYDLSNLLIMANETVTRKIPLYKGSALITFGGDTFTCATTGDIEALSPGTLLVTGSGTITLTYVGD